MRCPSCSAENPREATRCPACGAALVKKPRRKGSQPDVGSPFERPTDPANWPATRAYWLAIAGLVPGLGLLCGPVAVVLGKLARPAGRSDGEQVAYNLATAAIYLGAAVSITNWLGLALMLAGWTGSAL